MTAPLRKPGLAFALLAALPAVAFAQGENPPVITNITVEIQEYNGISYGPLQPFNEGDSTNLLVGWTPGIDIAREFDIIRVTVEFTDLDIGDDEDDDDEEEFWWRQSSIWWFDPPYPPEPPPIDDEYEDFTRVFPLLDPVAQTGTFTYAFLVPEWAGPSQARLRDPDAHPYDLGWWVVIELSNDEEPQEDESGSGASEGSFVLFAVENTALLPPNPPPIADAGADQLVGTGATVVLDATESFDGSNVGFDPLDPDVFLKDDLQVAWEWVSGPAQVEPEPDDVTPLLARVTLTDLGEYVYRVTITDGVNPVPSTDTVLIEVVNRDQLPENNLPPLAIIGDVQPVTVGNTITLDGRSSWDPDPNDVNRLRFFWRQTNELGGALTQEELQNAFQPLAGLETSADPDSPLYDADLWGRSTWRATTPGTFYFRLLVTDPLGATSSDLVAVQVVEATAGETINRPGENDTPPDAAPALVAPMACGGTLVPLALVPIALLASRGRYRK